jgi:hypothetical protein
MSMIRSGRTRLLITASTIVAPLVVSIAREGWDVGLLIPMGFVLPVAVWAERRARRAEVAQRRS